MLNADITDEENVDYLPEIKKNLVKHLNDLKEKIEKSEPFPHGPQDLKSLIDIDDKIEECLDNWYY